MAGDRRRMADMIGKVMIVTVGFPYVVYRHHPIHGYSFHADRDANPSHLYADGSGLTLDDMHHLTSG